MDRQHPQPSESEQFSQRQSTHSRERVIMWVIIGLALLPAAWALRTTIPTTPATKVAQSESVGILLPETIPLATGEEPVNEIITRAGCPVCHRIPGISGANGQVGPPLILGTTGVQRLSDPRYQGQAKTVHDYIIESVLEPGKFVVAGYPAGTMPAWYGSKLSASALEKIALYLEQQTESMQSH
jgi:hypothetical protein